MSGKLTLLGPPHAKNYVEIQKAVFRSLPIFNLVAMLEAILRVKILGLEPMSRRCRMQKPSRNTENQIFSAAISGIAAMLVTILRQIS